MKAIVVLTSINDCTDLLNGYLANFAKFGHDAGIILIPDRKTPSFLIPKGVKVVPFESQNDILVCSGFHVDSVPWDSDNRRNIGYLHALELGAEVVISIDDDNYCTEGEDFIGAHLAGLTNHQQSVEVEFGWYNNCNLLRPPCQKIFPRGFPYYARRSDVTYSVIADINSVVMNSGMWLVDPDLDAITWTTMPYRSMSALGSVVLGPGTWCPVNSQNTAVTRAMMPAYWFVRMYPPMDRFGDIFQGYFALKVAKHFGWSARFGNPFVRHIRNSHVYMKDIAKEIDSILLIEELMPKLMELKLSGETVHEAYLCLADFIESQSSKFYSDTARLMRLWANSCKVIG